LVDHACSPPDVVIAVAIFEGQAMFGANMASRIAAGVPAGLDPALTLVEEEDVEEDMH
jgi:hypothetical protein